MTDSELATRAQSIARCLSYNGNEHEAAAKHTLLEMASRLNNKVSRVHKKKDGFLIVNARGGSRFLTFKESILYRFFGVLPNKVR